MDSYIVRLIFKSGYYHKYLAAAARINKFMRITQKKFGVDMKKIQLIWDNGGNQYFSLKK